MRKRQPRTVLLVEHLNRNLNDVEKFATFEEDETGITVTLHPIRLGLSGCHKMGERVYSGSAHHLLTALALAKAEELLEYKAKKKAKAAA